MKKAIYIIFLCAFILVILNSSSKSKSMLDKKLLSSEINKIQVKIGYHPKYGSESKIITDPEEIESMLKVFNYAKAESKVNSLDITKGSDSSYYFFNDDNLIYKVEFNGIDSQKVRIDKDYYYANYFNNPTPYELYENSQSELITVDKNLNKIDKPLS